MDRPLNHRKKPMPEGGPPLLRSLRRAAAAILSAPRAVLALSLGGPLLFARGVWWIFDHASEEGERQLERLRSRLASVSQD
jgi:hypothetical protein